MANKITKIVTAAAVLATLVAPQAALAAAPAPTLKNDNPTAKNGDWYVGATPSNVDTSKPVILFVQGLHSDYTTWYNSDGFYDAAYNAGYRTAFVQLKDADGAGGTMWENGSTLAGVITKVKNYYGVSKINIVAHSKGGIDTQTALVHYGAYPYVNLVHQLSTPNRGSELADMAYSTWTSWLASILGQKDDATYVLQTSYMDYFRSVTDGRSENNYTRTYMSGGSGDDGVFSATFYSRAFLPGEDDGAVAIYSAFGLPNGYYGFEDNGSERLSHTKMRWASKTWWQVRPKLTTTSYYGVTGSALASSTSYMAKKAVDESSSNIMRGGEINGQAVDTFTLEKGTKANIDVMTSKLGTNVKLVSPSGKEYLPTTGKAQQDDAVLFADAVHNSFEIKGEAGTWSLIAEGNADAYFMVAAVEGGSKSNVKAAKKNFKKGEKVDLTVALQGGKADQKSKKQLKAKLSKSGKQAAQDVALNVNADGSIASSFTAPTEPGIYNVSFDVDGINANGEAFTRSVNYNFAVLDENGKL
ncbi:alpha/beta hydrolase [Tumebacillus algifaecis]|uniref:Alpha/beta hydrolase n=1 Tax=Tumebacillus algifaecis TaxID=1214604 RepID=A0A223D609_9BACL|nr:alpha/beta hydrolase [Tumebacillus algifaecis]ASS77032.1 alpha/beta hydrolase [Tumebacillus algifaecis]